MRYLVGQTLMGGKINFQDMGESSEAKGVSISFPLFGPAIKSDAERLLVSSLSKNGIDWLLKDHKSWVLHCEPMKSFFALNDDYDWLKGEIRDVVEFYNKREKIFDREEDRAYIRVRVFPEDIMNQQQKKIFLSHKGIDKPFVRRISEALRLVGLDPWLDEDALVAGSNLERGLREGFQKSCAAVFFLSTSFLDEKYLASEIDYAIQEMRKKDGFRVISLIIPDSDGKIIRVPDLLSPYVWRTCSDDLSVFTEIIRAIPLQVAETGWRH